MLTQVSNYVQIYILSVSRYCKMFHIEINQTRQSWHQQIKLLSFVNKMFEIKQITLFILTPLKKAVEIFQDLWQMTNAGRWVTQKLYYEGNKMLVELRDLGAATRLYESSGRHYTWLHPFLKLSLSALLAICGAKLWCFNCSWF